jgi:hypothetical protein
MTLTPRFAFLSMLWAQPGQRLVTSCVLRCHPPPKLSGLVGQRAGVGSRFSFGSRRAAHGPSLSPRSLRGSMRKRRCCGRSSVASTMLIAPARGGSFPGSISEHHTLQRSGPESRGYRRSAASRRAWRYPSGSGHRRLGSISFDPHASTAVVQPMRSTQDSDRGLVVGNLRHNC